MVDVEILKSASIDTAQLEEVETATITYELTVQHTNVSQLPATGVTVSDVMPAGVIATAATASAGGTCDVGDGSSVECSFPDALGLTGSFSITITAETSEAGAYLNVATVSVNEIETTVANNVDDAAVEVAVVLGVEILPETGAESDLLAMIATVLMVVGAGLVLGSSFRSGESFLA